MGVKSLWNLLEPVGRPVLLETMEGKAMAIDSSIWIYQFQATMRDKEGRGLVNAPVLGFLRRICKLLFYGIKPVFVFDGGAPALKRSTISERKNKKSGAAASHAKIAERLLAAHMRREALDHAQGPSPSKPKSKSAAPSGPVRMDENTVYLEDLEGNGPPKTPAKQTGQPPETSPDSSAKKTRWRDHDPYRLPDVDLDAAVAKATGGNAPDPRLATEEELRMFIEEMRPEDFDITSTEFRELPTEVQYEIIGDLRLKSRQTSYKRLQNMLKNAKTPLDFSKEQIKNLKQRNALTQQLLVTTDSIGKAHVEIPIRIASERNKQYLLIKNEGEEGGWILGVRDEGSRSKPIVLDQESPTTKQVVQDEDSDMDMEEVKISPKAVVDPDLREYRRTQALTALANRYKPKGLAPLTTKPSTKKRRRAQPLFVPEDDEVEEVADDDDPEMALAIQESLELEEESSLRRALEESKAEAAHDRVADAFGSNVGASTSRSMLDSGFPALSTTGGMGDDVISVVDSDDDLYASPTRLETALSFANTGPKRSPTKPSGPDSPFGRPTLLLGSVSPTTERAELPKLPSPPVIREPVASESDDELEEVVVAPLAAAHRTVPEVVQQPIASSRQEHLDERSDEEMEFVTLAVSQGEASTSVDVDEDTVQDPVEAVGSLPPSQHETPQRRIVRIADEVAVGSDDDDDVLPTLVAPAVDAFLQQHIDSSDSESDDGWVRASTPVVALPTLDSGNVESQEQVQPTVHEEEAWDAAHEMDPQAEEGEFARFMSQVRGRNLADVRREIDDEIRALNQQKKVAMRDSEDVTQQMVSQIMMMLRLFGIPYITAPMEAEAQCAELLNLGLVDGIITDDSDVFLFGGARILRHMFNQSKTVECFLLSDLERELSLDREKLVHLAYLLGSDYTEGLPGVGPVVAMELLTEFPGPDGLHKFREWWRKVQSGKDSGTETGNKFRKRFKKRFKELFLSEDWPNPAVRDAYYHPTVDSSEEHFKWGIPDLDALRGFFKAELGWSQEKVDDLLLPIIRKMSKRSQAGSTNKQGNLSSFFDIPTGGGAPRKRQAYSSRRLQQVVADYRAKRASGSSAASHSDNNSGEESNGEDHDAPPKPNKRRRTNGSGSASRSTTRARRGRGAGARGRGKGKGPSRENTDQLSSNETEPSGHSVTEAPAKPKPKPRPVRRKTGNPTNDHGSDDDEWVPGL